MVVHPAELRASETTSDSRLTRQDESAHRADAAASVPAPRRVLYVLSQFPSLSETFIVREMQALIDSGVDVRILSLKVAADRIVQPQAAAMIDRVWYPAGRGKATLAATATLLRHPVVTLAFL